MAQPQYGSGGAPPPYQEEPGKVPAGYPQGAPAGAYGPPAGGAYGPPAGGAYGPPAGGAYGPPGGAYGPNMGAYQPAGAMPGYQQQGYGVIVQPTPSQVVIVGGCPSCRVGVLEDDFTCLGVCCAILFFPIGILCCLAMKQRRCPNCGAVFS